ncbi:type III polyketide synthase [Pollutibacter soli]|uniref:type III polyketide synthase n=1 Tax=Pollutibacter soli TaxID=3034157 RepID=UPI003013E18F
MSKIISIGTAVPQFRHEQEDIMHFMKTVYALPDTEYRKLKYLYHHSGIDTRYSVVGDYSRPMNEWKFYPRSENLEPFPNIEGRMQWFNRYAAPLSVDAIRKCLEQRSEKEITHLITVSCTGMSAPGLDLQIMELMDLPRNIQRTSVNFMGCYAAIHAMKMADAICRSDIHATVLIVCTELCTLHFQKGATFDNIASSLLFADGSAAILICPDDVPVKGLKIENFYAEIVPKGKKDMSWELSSSGFVMSLSNYVPDLINDDIAPLMQRALEKSGITENEITHWCIHPGGKRILEAVQNGLGLESGQLDASYRILRHFGNMSSASILFVLKEIMQHVQHGESNRIFGLAFGPGLTMETFLATSVS